MAFSFERMIEINRLQLLLSILLQSVAVFVFQFAPGFSLVFYFRDYFFLAPAT